jgi:hypothetical protein
MFWANTTFDMGNCATRFPSMRILGQEACNKVVSLRLGERLVRYMEIFVAHEEGHRVRKYQGHVKNCDLLDFRNLKRIHIKRVVTGLYAPEEEELTDFARYMFEKPDLQVCVHYVSPGQSSPQTFEARGVKDTSVSLCTG